MSPLNNPPQPTPLAVVFTENLRALLTETGLTQKTLAERAGISENTIGKLLRPQTQVRFETLESIAGVFDVPPHALFERHAK